MQCPQCGENVNEGDRFCASCGTRLDTSGGIPRQFEPTRSPDDAMQPIQDRPTPEREPAPEDPADPEWRMSSLPDEGPPKRRRWLWIVGGLLIFCVLLVCAFAIFLMTDPGQNLLDDLGTRAAEVATGTP